MSAGTNTQKGKDQEKRSRAERQNNKDYKQAKNVLIQRGAHCDFSFRQEPQGPGKRQTGRASGLFQTLIRQGISGAATEWRYDISIRARIYAPPARVAGHATKGNYGADVRWGAPAKVPINTGHET